MLMRPEGESLPVILLHADVKTGSYLRKGHPDGTGYAHECLRRKTITLVLVNFFSRTAHDSYMF